jgi:hypothetical protein
LQTKNAFVSCAQKQRHAREVRRRWSRSCDSACGDVETAGAARPSGAEASGAGSAGREWHLAGSARQRAFNAATAQLSPHLSSPPDEQPPAPSGGPNLDASPAALNTLRTPCGAVRERTCRCRTISDTSVS